TWSKMVGVAEQAAELAAEQGIGIEVIDLRTLWPWDQEMVFASVAKTKRLMVVHEAVQVGGFGAEIAATVAEHMAHVLTAPICRMGAPRAPIS
ncbi:MAG: alpha-ketoacid dehydrogenase subunit beta, partial [Alphaproteobacteria bacterium]|nr:alpha-ketoacid dehydrogenase subunit beta [Alphaproteobacteria bacterium]